MIQSLKRWKKKQDFNPGPVAVFINPFYIARRGLWCNVRDLAVQLDGDLLDVGCGRKPYRELFRVKSYLGMDIENPGHSHKGEDIDVYYDGKHFPFETGTFDSLLCNQVLEHVFNPDEFLSEMSRVLKAGGKLLLTVPFAWDEHEQPQDFARYSSFGLKHLFEKHGLEIIAHRKSVNRASAIFQLWNTYLYKVMLTRSGIINLITGFFFISPFTLLGIFFGFILPRNNDFYLDNIVLARKR